MSSDPLARPRRSDTSGEAEAPAIGVLNIDKPQGLTSHDVVARVRRLTGQRRVGHAGTLDPSATGVLILCVGRATRILEYLTEGTKRYRATIRFGLVTDTWDATGRPVAQGDWHGLTLEALEKALERFRGHIEQVPPLYSALKHKGQPLYRLARRGIEVERPSRAVDIYALHVVSWHPPDLTLEIECSKGTYIRSLAHDLGQTLGPGAHLAALTRLAVGRFTLGDAVPLALFEEAARQGRWQEYLIPLREALGHLPMVMVDAEQAKRIVHGRAVPLDVQGRPDIVCALDPAGRLLAILCPTNDDLW
ncbi:MAG: tRNA pseudouridine(55) synthase TruB, partial [Chloroflexi bacterium]|nr:tRNA pseudouridine(55) synthase TruB [Chloroflexota bacterium]